jgi:hypothetical protein
MFTNMKLEAEKKFLACMNSAHTLKELESMLESGGFIKVPFCSMEKDGEECTAKIEKLHAKVRGTLFGKKDDFSGKECIACGKHAKHIAYVAKAY